MESTSSYCISKLYKKDEKSRKFEVTGNAILCPDRIRLKSTSSNLLKIYIRTKNRIVRLQTKARYFPQCPRHLNRQENRLPSNFHSLPLLI